MSSKPVTSEEFIGFIEGLSSGFRVPCQSFNLGVSTRKVLKDKESMCLQMLLALSSEATWQRHTSSGYLVGAILNSFAIAIYRK